MAAHGRLKKAKYQCHQCQAAHTYQARRAMRCGYVRAEDWTTPLVSWGYIGGSPIRQPETCPGYTTTLQVVHEVADAWGWWKRGQLGMMRDLPLAVTQLVSLFNSEVIAAEGWYYDEVKPKK